MVKFIRRAWYKMSKLGKGRKKKQVWRNPTGRDNKLREKRRGYGAFVSIGYGGVKGEKGKIAGKAPVMVSSIKDLDAVKKDEIIIIKSVGKKRKIEILKKAKTKGLEVHNVNVKKFLKKNVKPEKKNESK